MAKVAVEIMAPKDISITVMPNLDAHLFASSSIWFSHHLKYGLQNKQSQHGI
jgi:hypothetical protein